jgi:hypothetical protein
MTLSMEVAEWVDVDLDETLQETLNIRQTRVFGITKHVNKNGVDVFHRRLVDADADPYALLVRVPEDTNVDAYCLVMTGWMSKMNEDDEPEDDGVTEPERIRVRVCAAVSDEGVSVMVRRWDTGSGPGESFADGGEGAFPDALKTWWTVSQGKQAIDELINKS